MPSTVKYAIRFKPCQDWIDYYFSGQSPDWVWVVPTRFKTVNAVNFDNAQLYANNDAKLAGIAAGLERDGHSKVEIVTVTCSF